jgi:hypothetical protein
MVGRVLEHHGIKGMRWGQRKTPSHPASADHVNTRANLEKAKNSGIKSLSNQELQAVINRRNLEKQYKEAGGGSRIENGRKHVKKILSDVKTLNDIYRTTQDVTKVVKNHTS